MSDWGSTCLDPDTSTSPCPYTGAELRRLKIVQILKEWGQQTTVQLADEIDASVRDVHQDCKVLERGNKVAHVGIVEVKYQLPRTAGTIPWSILWRYLDQDVGSE